MRSHKGRPDGPFYWLFAKQVPLVVRWLVRECLIAERDQETGYRLKYYSRTADVAYWTALWQSAREVSYEREKRGHLPHQLRATFRRWVEPGATTLEAGCGLGHFTVAADALGYRAEGLDWSESTIGCLRQRFSGITWHIGDVRCLQFGDGVFDAVYSPGVCEHFEEGPIGILMETRRVLRRGGIALVQTPCFNAWLQWREAKLTSPVPPEASEFYQYAFTPEGMAHLLERLGFEVLQVHPYAVLGTFMRYAGWRVPRPVVNVVAFPMDYLPVVRKWGSTCLWVARKR